MLLKLMWYVKGFLGLGTVDDGFICWFSRKFWDIHDYHEFTGGDGIPEHFRIYKCSNCGKEFII